MLPIADLYAVVPAGGSGTRLWPLSRQGRPKFLLDLIGQGRTMIQTTVDRLLPLTGADHVLVVTGTAHEDQVRAQLPELDGVWDQVIAEPSPRDSMAAIGLAAAVIAQRHGPTAIIGSFAADHVITGQDLFEQTVVAAVSAARMGYVVCVGIEATSPSSAFGYVQATGTSVPDADAQTRVVAGFTEKPDAQTAAEYLRSGNYYWNAGMFVVQVGVLLGHLARLLPTMHAALIEIAAQWDGAQRAETLERLWPTLTRIAIDRAIAEPIAPAGAMAVVPGNFGWDDLGDFSALARLHRGDGSRVLGDQAQVVQLGGADAFVVVGTRPVTVVGNTDVVVVDTPDALLVVAPAQAQDVAAAVAHWRENGQQQLL